MQTLPVRASSAPAGTAIGIFARLVLRLPPWLKGIGAGLAALLIAVAGYWGVANHPTGAPPQGAAAEKQIAKAFGVPLAADPVLVGDLLIERFYVRDSKSGKFFVVDLAKGLVTDVVMSQRKDLTGAYTVLLSSAGTEARRAEFEAFAKKQAPPTVEFQGEYLGLKVQASAASSFAVNYSGSVPNRRMGLRGPNNLQWTSLLASQPDLSTGAQLIGIRGTNFLLSSTQWFPGFLSDSGIESASFVSQVMFLDLTGQRASPISTP